MEDLELIKRLGLGNSLLRRMRKFTDEPVAGPGGKTGALMTPSRDHGVPKYKPNSQTWRECAGGEFWLGFLTDDRPTPKDLIKDGAKLDGYEVPLDDQNDWRIATAKFEEVEGGLPNSVCLDVNGNLVEEPMGRYAKLTEYARLAYDGLRHVAFGDGEPVEIDKMFKWNACVEALSLSYHVTNWEVSALKVISTANYDLILSSMCDFQTYARARMASDKVDGEEGGGEEGQKKRASALALES
jgi:hypothetical protein